MIILTRAMTLRPRGGRFGVGLVLLSLLLGIIPPPAGAQSRAAKPAAPRGQKVAEAGSDAPAAAEKRAPGGGPAEPASPPTGSTPTPEKSTPQTSRELGEQVTLPPLVVTAPPPISASSEILIPGKDVELLPQGRPADVLRLIPGLIIGQHQGGGKAEQYFLRGFDSDHGTDIALFVDNLPVNLRSHAHGQGYADLHFLIPETVKQVEATKGPYFVELGDFDVAGAVNFVLKDYVEENSLTVGGGNWNTERVLALLSPTRGALKTFIAGEYYHSDGPFESPNEYHRFNLLLKASGQLSETMTLAAWTSAYYASWNGSGEIPLRAVNDGLITRFGAIDSSEGGNTTRENVNLIFTWRPTDNQVFTAHAYGTYYDLDLFNNFTLFLNDRVDGDEINQRDRRALAGVDLAYQRTDKPFGINVTTTAGFQYRIDTPHVVLAHARQRQVLSITQDVNIIEQSWSPFLKFDIVPVDKVRLVLGARGDIFNFNVNETIDTTDTPRLTGKETSARPNVKANLILGPWYDTEFFANCGTGFHSNDARAIIADPNLPALPTALGYEFGARTKVLPQVDFSATYWVLKLESELAFVGDEGTTEASPSTTRQGVEVFARAQLLDWLSFYGDFTYTFKAEFDNGDAIPLAPDWTAFAGLTARSPWGLEASIQFRYVGDRPANEDRTAIAQGYYVFDFVARYRWKFIEAFFSVENLANQDFIETQFFFQSRPRPNAKALEDVHFVPGNPRTFFGGLTFYF